MNEHSRSLKQNSCLFYHLKQLSFLVSFLNKAAFLENSGMNSALLWIMQRKLTNSSLLLGVVKLSNSSTFPGSEKISPAKITRLHNMILSVDCQTRLSKYFQKFLENYNKFFLLRQQWKPQYPHGWQGSWEDGKRDAAERRSDYLVMVWGPWSIVYNSIIYHMSETLSDA